MAGPSDTRPEEELVRALFERALEDLALVLDRPFELGDVDCERATEKVVAENGIHLSFRQVFELGDEAHEGCVLVPLPDALALAGYLVAMPDDQVEAQRGRKTLDDSLREALVEIASFLAGSMEAELRARRSSVVVRSGGCQGVGRGAKPNFRYAGGELVVGRLAMTLHEQASFDAIAMLPAGLCA